MEASVDVLLVGGGVASVRCARALRRAGFDGSVLLVGGEPILPYNRPPLSKELLRDDLPDDLVSAEPASWYERRRIGVRLGTRVSVLDPSDRLATLDDGSTIRYERCLVATGAEPMTLPVPGGEHGITLRTLADARRLRARALAAPAGARVVVVGGGFIGVEVASGLAVLGLRPLVVERAGSLWAGALGEQLAEWGRSRLAEAGVEVRLGAGVTRLEPDAAWIGDERIDVALTVVGVGVWPRVELARAAGLAEDDGIVTDLEQRTNRAGVWAAGDVARSDGLRVEHWHAARESGERAAHSMLGEPVPPPRPPWLFTEVGGTPLDLIGVASDWDEERWVRPGSVLAFVAGETVVQLAAIGSAVDPGAARDAVAAGVTVPELEALLPPA